MLVSLRPENHVKGILAIYAPIVQESAISFEHVVPSLSQMLERIRGISKAYPFIVFEENGQVLGYAYAGRFRERAAYQWCCELSVYVHPDAQKQGIGRKLYSACIKATTAMGFQQAIAVITLPNKPSVVFHEQLGFTPSGKIAKAGLKFRKWWDIGIWQMALQTDSAIPNNAPQPIDLKALLVKLQQ